MLSTVSDLLDNKIATPLKIRLQFHSSKMTVRCPTAWKPVPFVIAINGNRLETGRLVRHSFFFGKKTYFSLVEGDTGPLLCVLILYFF